MSICKVAELNSSAKNWKTYYTARLEKYFIVNQINVEIKVPTHSG